MVSEGILIFKCEGRATEIVESWVKIKGTTTYVLQTMDERLEWKLLKKKKTSCGVLNVFIYYMKKYKISS